MTMTLMLGVVDDDGDHENDDDTLQDVGPHPEAADEEGL
jgi:hypothetical protein